jgi:hypothetical protein
MSGSMTEDEQLYGSPFLTQKAQVKGYCLALCPKPRRRRGSEYRLRVSRERYYDDIVLCSAHCDVSEPDIGVDATARQLDEEQKGVLFPKEGLELADVSRTLAGRILVPEERRLGRKSTAFRAIGREAMSRAEVAI